MTRSQRRLLLVTVLLSLVALAGPATAGGKSASSSEPAPSTAVDVRCLGFHTHQDRGYTPAKYVVYATALFEYGAKDEALQILQQYGLRTPDAVDQLCAHGLSVGEVDHYQGEGFPPTRHTDLRIHAQSPT